MPHASRIPRLTHSPTPLRIPPSPPPYPTAAKPRAPPTQLKPQPTPPTPTISTNLALILLAKQQQLTERLLELIELQTKLLTIADQKSLARCSAATQSGKQCANPARTPLCSIHAHCKPQPQQSLESKTDC